MIPAETLRRMYIEDDRSTGTIAQALKCSKEHVRQQLERNGIALRGRSEAALSRNSIWTPERDAKLEKLWLEGKTCGEIKDLIGAACSKHSIGSRARRLGLPRRAAPVQRSAQRRNTQQIANLAVAVGEAKLFVHQSLISFADVPHLQAQYAECMRRVKAQRRCRL